MGCKPLFKQNSKPLIQKSKVIRFLQRTGQLKRSIGFFTTKSSRRYNGGYVGPRVKGAFAKRDKTYKGSNKKKIYTKSGFYGAWLEYGNEVMFGGRGTGKAQEIYATSL